VALLAQEDMPTVVFWQGRYYVWDGHHRLAAIALARLPFARVKVLNLDTLRS
jgi:ParB-like chromosome segregation protein Spo0J